MVGKGQVDTNDNVAYRESRFQISLTMAKNELATSLVRTRDLNCNGFSTKNFIVGLSYATTGMTDYSLAIVHCTVVQ